MEKGKETNNYYVISKVSQCNPRSGAMPS
ncbi:hypothetical protein MTBBW1_2130007 [Desulfamplus magnetovallimortis]|uniref:Uncharacterized protein n=1 Tax=Desulfamplus magnetovallimortis TaxID=1246637 RepID=A0A1W1HCI9_9BACT|nr:hypothetical protein MTBBW1_2130007 [Desulfamplus magnetovallimortis]